MGNERSTAADQFIGIRIRERRIKRGLSQRRLGELVGVTHQQVNKYEQGGSGVSASRLYEIAHELSTPLEYFFEGLEQNERQSLLRERMLLDVMRNLGEVRNEKYLGAIRELTRVLAGR
jgi:transcriptional regulator with XRE-family HTH domain